jgi:hypothetical protein
MLSMALDHRATYVRSILGSLVAVVGLVPLGLWARHLDIGPGTVPLFDASGRSYWLAGMLFTVFLGVLFQALDRVAMYAISTAVDRGVRYEPISELPTGWILPLVTTITAVMLLAIYHSQGAIACIALGTFFATAAGSIARWHLFDADANNRGRARGFYTILIHVIAFFSLSMVYINKVRSLFSATAVLLVAVVLLVQLTEGEDALFARRLVYGLVGGVMLGQVTWVLNYWEATGWTGGAALLVFFYLCAGLIMSQIREGVNLRDVLEFGSVSVLAFAIVMYSLFG